MKKFTLLCGLAIVAGLGSAMAQEVQTIRGIKITPDDAAPEARYYYSISNMRIQRLNYSDGRVAGYDFDTNETLWAEDEIFMTDAMQVPLPLFLPDGYPEDWEEGSLLEDYDPSEYKLTPQPYEFPYMGLAVVDGGFWLAFSAQSEVMDPSTTYWYFTKGSGTTGVRIHNAVIDGTVKRNSEFVLGRKATGFDTGNNNYYVLNMKDIINDHPDFGEGSMALNDEQLEASFALSISNLTDKNIEEGKFEGIQDRCLDVNNYITYNHEAIRLNSDGSEYLQEVEDPETGDILEEPVTLQYGFASVDRTWSPLRTNGSNENHLYNNGSLFFVNEQPTADALAAIEAYKEVVLAAYREAAKKGAKEAYATAAGVVKGWVNVPALWKDQTTLAAIIAELENYDGGNPESVVDLKTQEDYIAAAQRAAQKKVNQAAGLVGTGAVVTLQNMLALRDVADAEDLAEDYQLGNAYIAADQPGYANIGGVMDEVEYTGIAPLLEANEYCQWELIHVEGTPSFYLYNAASNTYIRKYSGMYELAGGDELFEGTAVDNFTWATTENVAEAAAFTFVGCADPEEQTALSEEDQVRVEDYEISTDVTNNVYLTSTVVETEVNEETGETVETSFSTSIHRTSSNYDYHFVNYGFENNRWYANSNIFNVGVVVEGGINEIEAAETAKTTGIYDLQGRKVAKAGKGLYIINGVKTIVR